MLRGMIGIQDCKDVDDHESRTVAAIAAGGTSSKMLMQSLLVLSMVTNTKSEEVCRPAAPDNSTGEMVKLVTLFLLMMAVGFINVCWRRVVPPETAAGQVIRGTVVSAKQSRGTQTDKAKKAMKTMKVQSQCTYTSVGPHPEVRPKFKELRRGEDGAYSD